LALPPTLLLVLPAVKSNRGEIMKAYPEYVLLPCMRDKNAAPIDRIAIFSKMYTTIS